MLSSLKSALTAPLLVLGGLFAVYLGYQSGQDAKALADHGKVVQATVDMVEWKEKRLSGREKSFKLDIHFETEDKQTIHTKVSVSKDMGRNFRDTDANTLAVRYLPEHPQTLVLDGEPDSSGGMMTIGAILAALGAVLFAVRRFTGKKSAG